MTKRTSKSKSRRGDKPAKVVKKAATRRIAAKGSTRTIFHKDGSIYGKGQMLGGKMHGDWEFFRKDGTIMRSGSFDREKQIGTWTTYDAGGNIVKVTEMKAGVKAKPGATAAKPRKTAPKSKSRGVANPSLLAGGNPQIAKSDGDAPVQAYIAAIPGWKKSVGRSLDALIVRTVPGVRKAVKWNSPFFGLEGQGWFLSFHCFTKYVKVAFFRGASLRPLPPGKSKNKNTRYLDIREGDKLNEAQMATWVQQAAALPGWVP